MRALSAVVAYLAIYAAALWHLSGFERFEAGEPLLLLAVFGILLPGVAWLVTRGLTPRPVSVRAPGREVAALAVFLSLFAVCFLGWGLSALRGGIPAGLPQDLAVLVAKLVTMVGVPLLLFQALGYRVSEVISLPRLTSREWLALGVMALLLGALQLTLGRGPKLIAELDPPLWQLAVFLPITLAWMSLEAGLTEEFVFRVLVQTRLSAWLRSETAGIAAMALLFGLAHAPGYFLRGQHTLEGFATDPGALTAIAYSIAVTSTVGFLFGVLWARTRSLTLVVLLHGWTDTIPNLAPTIRSLTGG